MSVKSLLFSSLCTTHEDSFFFFFACPQFSAFFFALYTYACVFEVLRYLLGEQCQSHQRVCLTVFFFFLCFLLLYYLSCFPPAL
jgi:uncharacterized membrane protein YozB (DUF420 family)